MGSPNHPSHWTIWSPKVLQADSNIHPEWLDAFWGAGKNSKTGFPLWSHEIPVISFTSQKSSEYCMIAAPKQIQHDLTLKNLEIMDKTNSSKRPPGKKRKVRFGITISRLRGSRCCSACRSNGNSSHTKVDPVPELLSPAPARTPRHLAAWKPRERLDSGKSRSCLPKQPRKWSNFESISWVLGGSTLW